MKTGFSGTFVISWSQTEVDGLTAAPRDALETGVGWCWHGEALRVDGPAGVLRLADAEGKDSERRRAARRVRRLVGTALGEAVPEMATEAADEGPESPLMDIGFVVTDGLQSYSVTLIEAGRQRAPLLMFHERMPPRDTELWVVHHTLDPVRQATAAHDPAGGVICFTPGTRIATPDGPRPVETLREGDRVQTKDNGPEEILWIGRRRMSGARLFAMPWLRPVRIRAGALGVERPDQELLVSPGHRMLVRGVVAQALFSTPEVLVAARDLIDHDRIGVDLALREVTYVHLLLPHHQVLWANGIETESFHPASAALSTLAEADRVRLLALYPGLEVAPLGYGGFARRNLTSFEAAVLTHEAA